MSLFVIFSILLSFLSTVLISLKRMKRFPSSVSGHSCVPLWLFSIHFFYIPLERWRYTSSLLHIKIFPSSVIQTNAQWCACHMRWRMQNEWQKHAVKFSFTKFYLSSFLILLYFKESHFFVNSFCSHHPLSMLLSFFVNYLFFIFRPWQDRWIFLSICKIPSSSLLFLYDALKVLPSSLSKNLHLNLILNLNL